jgi:hypothetical protein
MKLIWPPFSRIAHSTFSRRVDLPQPAKAEAEVGNRHPGDGVVALV